MADDHRQRAGYGGGYGDSRDNIFIDDNGQPSVNPEKDKRPVVQIAMRGRGEQKDLILPYPLFQFLTIDKMQAKISLAQADSAAKQQKALEAKELVEKARKAEIEAKLNEVAEVAKPANVEEPSNVTPFPTPQ